MFKHDSPFVVVIAQKEPSKTISTQAHSANRWARRILQAGEMP
jgi:hypothetical protein